MHTGWKNAALTFVAGAAIVALAANAIPLGRPANKEPPTPGVQMDIVAFEPPPSGPNGPTGNNFDPPTGGGGGSGGTNFDPPVSGGGGSAGTNFDPPTSGGGGGNRQLPRLRPETARSGGGRGACAPDSADLAG